MKHKQLKAQHRRFNKAIAPYWKSLESPTRSFVDPKQYQMPDLGVLEDIGHRAKILPHEMIDAASKGELTRVRQAIELDGVNASYVDPDLWGDTALHRAAENGHMHVVRYLCLRASCNTRAKSDANGETAQRAAEKALQWHIVAFLKGFEQWQSRAEESSTCNSRAEALRVSAGDVATATLSPKYRLLEVVRTPTLSSSSGTNNSSILPNLERVASSAGGGRDR